MNKFMNPYLPEGVYVPDGEPHVFGDRVYVYGSRDLPNGHSFCMGDYEVWSAPIDDLSNWSCPGVALKKRKEKDPFGANCMWAPDVMQGPDGRYYIYYCFAWQNLICVGVSDKPDGPYTYIGVVHHKDGKPYGHKKGDRHCFDPGCLRDDDGKNYLYSGYSCDDPGIKLLLLLKRARNIGAFGNQVMRLGEDMMTIEEGPKNLIPGKANGQGTGFEGHEFYEASSMRKFNGKYYAIYSSSQSHELAYAISDYPDRDFVFGGVLCSNCDIGYEGRTEPIQDFGNTHGSVEYINGKYYVFYHRQTNFTENNRQGIAEVIEMDETGHFKMVEMTSYGMLGHPFDEYGVYPAYIAVALKGKSPNRKVIYGKPAYDKFPDHPFFEYRDGHQLLCNLCDGAVAGYKYFNFDKQVNISIKLRGEAGEILLADNPDMIGAAVAKFDGSVEWYDLNVPYIFKGKKAPLYISYRGPGAATLFSFEIKE